jgi:plasmid stabilization system protein ParE
VLKQNPQGLPQGEIRPELRRLVITRQTSVLYTIKEDIIFIVTLFDNRQNPKKIEAEIKNQFG